MSPEKAKNHVHAVRHFENARRWQVVLSVGPQHFKIDTPPLTKREAGWFMRQLRHALTQL